MRFSSRLQSRGGGSFSLPSLGLRVQLNKFLVVLAHLLSCLAHTKQKSPTLIMDWGFRFQSLNCLMPVPILEHVMAFFYHGQVFWLPVLSTYRAFPSCKSRTVASCGFRPRSQRRVRDGIAPSSL